MQGGQPPYFPSQPPPRPPQPSLDALAQLGGVPNRPPPRPPPPTQGSFTSLPTIPQNTTSPYIALPNTHPLPAIPTSPFPSVPSNLPPIPTRTHSQTAFPQTPTNLPPIPSTPSQLPPIPSKTLPQVPTTQPAMPNNFTVNNSYYCSLPPTPTTLPQIPSTFSTLPPIPSVPSTLPQIPPDVRQPYVEAPVSSLYSSQGMMDAPIIPKRAAPPPPVGIPAAQPNSSTISPAGRTGSPVTLLKSTSKDQVIDWLIYPAKIPKISKSKREDLSSYREKLEVDLPPAIPNLIFRFEPSICFELVNGKLFDANIELYPLPDKSKILPKYRVDFLQCDAGEKKYGEIRLYRLDSPVNYETIFLYEGLACLFVRAGVYFFQATGPRFFVVQLPLDITPEQLDEIDNWLMNFVILNRINPHNEVIEENTVNKTATIINSGGEVLGQGLAKGSELIGKGMRSGTKLYTSKTKKHEEAAKELTEEEIERNKLAQQRLENADKASTIFVKGSRGVKMGIEKGFGLVGRSGAAVIDGSSKAVKKTDWYKKKEANKPATTGEKEDSGFNSFVTVAKSSVNAGSSVISGAKQGTRTVAKDVRDTTVDLTEHHKGKEAAEQTKAGFNILGKTALGGAFCVQIYTTHTFTCLAYTGLGAATYDPNKKEVLSGIAWKVGWVTKQGSYLNPWSPRFAILRTYSLSFYKSPKDSQPTSYYPVDEIKSASFAPASVTEKELCFNVQTKSELLYFSLDMESLTEELGIDTSSLQTHLYIWVNSINALAAASRHSLLKKKKLN